MEDTFITLGTHTQTADMPILTEATRIQMEEDILAVQGILQEVLDIRKRVLVALILVTKQVASKGWSTIRQTIGLKCQE